MARKEMTVTLQDGEQTLTFKIRQFSCTAAVGWGIRAVMALAKSGVEFPEGANFQEAFSQIMAGGPNVAVRVLGGLAYQDVNPLMEELLGCCSRVIDNYSEKCTTESVDAYMTEPGTLVKLYFEALKVNFMKPE